MNKSDQTKTRWRAQPRWWRSWLGSALIWVVGSSRCDDPARSGSEGRNEPRGDGRSPWARFHHLTLRSVTAPAQRASPTKLWHCPWLAVLVTLALTSNQGWSGDSALTKYQVEAVFLYNFAKYVDWPDTAFPDASAPLTIGVMGADPFGDSLAHAVDGKTIKGRTFVIRHLTADSDLTGCQILFISDSEAAQMGKILERAAALPILTVGEDDAFAQNNGIINFTLKEEKVRLEIDLTTTRQTGLTISSRLLAVADTVKGRAK